MSVSVVIPNYNGRDFCVGCIDSLFKMKYRDFKIILVDNGSTDGSVEFLKNKYPDVQFICLDKNYGFSRAVNEGIKLALKQGDEYVALLNNDTVVDEGWLGELVKCIGKNKRIFSCCSKMIQFNNRELIDDAGDNYMILAWAYKDGDNLPVTDPRYCKDRYVFSSCAGAAIYSSRALRRIGLFDEDFFAYVEDVDISYRAKLKGYKNIYCSAAEVFHIGSGTSGSKYNKFKVRYAARNNVLLVLKNMPAWQIVINSPFILTGFAVKYIFFLRKDFGKEYAAGIVEGIRFAGVKKYTVKAKFRNVLRIEFEMIINLFKYLHYYMRKRK